MKTLLRNAKIFTASPKGDWAEALVYEDDKILYVGRDDREEWEKVTGNDVKEIDAEGKAVFPGFIDSHIHPAAVAMSAWHIKVPMFDKVEDFLDHIGEYARKHPKEEIPFLYFEYYPTDMFDVGGPTKELLDRVINDRPCLCQDFGEHMHWVNSRMLELMEVDASTPDPVPGLEMFERDEDGNPTGWVKEFAWQHFAEKMYEKIGWTPPETVDEDTLMPVLDFFKEHGITAVFDAVIESEEQLEALKRLEKQGKLKVFYDAAVRFWSYEDLPEKIALLRDYQKKYGGGQLQIRTMKLFLDGTNEAGNGALLEPHINDPQKENYGEIKMERDELVNCLLLCNEEGLDVHIHIVGDRAFRTGWQAVEQAQGVAAGKGKPWNIQVVLAHCEMVAPEDMGKPAQLGISINWSCHWSGGYFGEEAKNFISEEKWNRMYRFNEMIASGAQVAFSSDVVTYYELERADPLFGIQIANTRIDPQFPLDAERYEGSVRPMKDARIPLSDLFRGYTIEGARQLHKQDVMGSLEAGKTANFCVLAQNPFETEKNKIKDITFAAVVYEGEVIHGAL
ncbi:MAG: amidohydrolase family protein [Bacillota bacterium]|nr:amidohydrolase family protein [Bacillota bacterium]